MKYLQSSFTMPPAEPNPEMCCEACVFGSGKHARWCFVFTDEFVEDLKKEGFNDSRLVKTGRDEHIKAMYFRDDRRFEIQRLLRKAWDRYRGQVPELEPLGPCAADCQFCPPSDCRDFDAVGYLPGFPDLPGAICARCLLSLSTGHEWGDNS
jgi:hypothetical protein